MLAAACTFMLSLLARTIAAGTDVDVRLMLHPNENVAGCSGFLDLEFDIWNFDRYVVVNDKTKGNDKTLELTPHSFTLSLFHSFTLSLFRSSFTLSLFHSFTLSLFHSFTLSLFHFCSFLVPMPMPTGTPNFSLQTRP